MKHCGPKDVTPLVVDIGSDVLRFKVGHSKAIQARSAPIADPEGSGESWSWENTEREDGKIAHQEAITHPREFPLYTVR